MQTYPFSLNRIASSLPINVDADLFVYESAAPAEYTNIALFSDALDNAAWSVDAGVTVERMAIPTDGTATAWRLTKTLVGDANLGQSQAILNDSERYVMQARVMKDAVSNRFPELYIRLQGGAVAEAYVHLNTKTGDWAIRTSTGGEVVTVTDAGSHWHVTVSVLNNGSGNTTARFGIRVALASSALGVYEPNTLGNITVFGLMCNKGSGPSPNIITTGIKATAALGDTTIIVKPENGSEIKLKPGQRFRLASGNARTWYIRSADGKSEFKGQVVIGSGEFDDANILNTFKFDTNSGAIPTTVQNAVTVTGELEIKNDVGNRIPVTLDATQTIPVQSAGPAINGSWQSSAGLNGGSVELFAPAANPRGVVVHSLQIVATNSIAVDCFFFATNGANQINLLYAPGNTNTANLCQLAAPIVLPPGYGLYYTTNTMSPYANYKAALWTTK